MESVEGRAFPTATGVETTTCDLLTKTPRITPRERQMTARIKPCLNVPLELDALEFE
jgi:hypothetical protein